MMAKGNGDPARCVQNLLQIARGEVPFDRIRGLDTTVFDRPAVTAAPALRSDAQWMLGVYEPRVAASSVEIKADEAKTGRFVVTADLE